MVRAHKRSLRATGVVEGVFKVETTDNLVDVIKSARFLVLGTRTDAHESFVAELEKFGQHLADTTLFDPTDHGVYLSIYPANQSPKYNCYLHRLLQGEERHYRHESSQERAQSSGQPERTASLF